MRSISDWCVFDRYVIARLSISNWYNGVSGKSCTFANNFWSHEPNWASNVSFWRVCQELQSLKFSATNIYLSIFYNCSNICKFVKVGQTSLEFFWCKNFKFWKHHIILQDISYIFCEETIFLSHLYSGVKVPQTWCTFVWIRKLFHVNYGAMKIW